MSSSLDYRNLHSYYELRSHYLSFHFNPFDDHQPMAIIYGDARGESALA